MPTSTKDAAPEGDESGLTFVRLTTVVATHVSRPPCGGVLRRRRVSVLLVDKSSASMRRAVGAINGIGRDDDGRQSTVLLHLQHRGRDAAQGWIVWTSPGSVDTVSLDGRRVT